MLTIYRILETYGIDPNNVRLVRHGNKEIPILETFQKNPLRLEAYQSFQNPNKFGDAKHIIVCAPYFKTTALFLGVWDINGITENSDFTQEIALELKRHNLPPGWYDHAIRYNLVRNTILDDLSERLLIEWGGSTVSWVQKKDKEIVEIKGKKSIGDFESFSLVNLDYRDLKNITEFPDTNLVWMKALSSVNGVYLIQDTSSGKLYVGSAYGKNGIYGRWSAYSLNGHGGNKELKDLDPNNFRFSILEIVSATTTADEVIDCENRWKEKLGTRGFGLNSN